MVWNLLKDTRDTAKERFANPYIGALSAVLLVRFWKVPAALLADDPHSRLLAEVDLYKSKMCPGDYLLIFLVYAPLAAVIPLALGTGLSWVRAMFHKARVEIEDQVLGTKRLTKEQGDSLRTRNEHLVRELASVVEVRDGAQAKLSQTTNQLSEMQKNLQGTTAMRNNLLNFVRDMKLMDRYKESTAEMQEANEDG